MRTLLLILFASRLYWPVTIAKMPQNTHTHVQVKGKVTLIKHEDDGDTHIRISDSTGKFIVAECIPQMPCVAPKVGDFVLVKGISRYDGKHKWPEIHPVEDLKRFP